MSCHVGPLREQPVSAPIVEPPLQAVSGDFKLYICSDPNQAHTLWQAVVPRYSVDSP